MNPSTARPAWKHATVIAQARHATSAHACYTSPPCPRHARETRQYRSRLFRTILRSHIADAHERSQVTPL